MRIGIANDLPIAVEVLRYALQQSGKHSVAWVAQNGQEAIDFCARDKPDLILMDLNMPGMDGVTATRRILRETACPILIVTASVGGKCAQVFEALGAGALDAISTPVVGASDPNSDCAKFLWKLDSIETLLRPALPVTDVGGCRPLNRSGKRGSDG